MDSSQQFQQEHIKQTDQEQHIKQKIEDSSNKYSFNSYHMNIISGNQNVQTYPSSQLQQQTNQSLNYFPSIQNFQSQQYYNSCQIQTLLNNMFVIINNQSKLLNYLIEKNDHNLHTTNKIYNSIKFNKKQEIQVRNKNDNDHIHQINYNEDISPSRLISFLYGPKTVFNYRLIIDSTVPFETPLYRQRNFKLKINLIDQNGKIFQNTNKIPISLALYTVQNPPKFLDSNTSGNKMLKGFTQQDLFKGVCLFQKIQIKQVTSHYRKNMLFLMAFAKVPSLGCIQNNNFVDYQQICPLVIDRVVVKAKKMKSDNNKKQIMTNNEKQEDLKLEAYQQ